MSETMPSVFIPHGGGPCFFMDWTMGPADSWDALAAWLRGYATTLPTRPTAVLVVSAHWEAPRVTVQNGASPGLLFDYYGFPAHTYQLRYPAPGAPQHADRVVELLRASGIDGDVDPARPYDHGVFIPLLLMFPDADIPVFQLSLHEGLDARFHIAVGEAIAPLRDDGVLIVGSGLSFHNLPLFMGRQGTDVSSTFDDWLACVASLGPAERREKLERWSGAPRAREAHPREEHLLPLMVTAGAGGDAPMTRVFTGSVHGHALSAFEFR